MVPSFRKTNTALKTLSAQEYIVQIRPPYWRQTHWTTKHTRSGTLRSTHFPHCHKDQSQNTYIFIHKLNIIYIINNHIRRLSSQHNHPHKLLISTIVQLLQTKHNITIQKLGHTEILGNEIAYQLPNVGTTCNKPIPTSQIHIAHTIYYWLNGIPTSKDHGGICNLQTYLNKYHCKQSLRIAKSNFTYIDKWVFHKQIKQLPTNHFQKALRIWCTNTQTLKLRSAKIHGILMKEHLLATNISEPQLHSLPKPLN